MKRDRVITLIDGFNLYHAIHNLHDAQLKWLNLNRLSQEFVHPVSEELVQVLYFSAIANHCGDASRIRQKAYLSALKLCGVKQILGQFKQKDRKCTECRARYIGHEEKETDVNISLALIDLAYQDVYDRALLITNDSDQAPAIRKVLERFPNKKITVLIPPKTRECNELIQVASNKAKITVEQLEKCLFPEIVCDANGTKNVRRPKEYNSLITVS
jgi:uncharacterized LabA/DUF88 family protein